MNGESIPAQGPELVFGAFRLLPQQRMLYRANTPVRIGSRAREILVALVERPGELMRKTELAERVWPNTTVEESTLRVHITSLRKALNDGKEGVRFVESVNGLGYRFVAPVSISQKTPPGMDGSPASAGHSPELRQLSEENARLRRLVADLTLEKHILEEKITGVARPVWEGVHIRLTASSGGGSAPQDPRL